MKNKVQDGRQMNENQWMIRSEGVDNASALKNESIFTVANGHIGFRYDLDEWGMEESSLTLPGTYLNGLFESETITYGERAYGFAEHGQTMVNLCNPKGISLCGDGEQFSWLVSETEAFAQELNMKDGLASHRLVWKLASGKRLALSSRRVVSFTRKEIAVLEYRIEALEQEVELTAEAYLNSRVSNKIVGDDPRVGSGLKEKPLEIVHAEAFDKDGKSYLCMDACTKNSCLAVSCVSVVETEGDYSVLPAATAGIGYLAARVTVRLVPGKPLVLRRTVAFTAGVKGQEAELGKEALRLAVDAAAVPGEIFFDEQRAYLTDFWNSGTIEIMGNNSLTSALRFNLFHLLQSAGTDGKTSISAKGLTGEGYEGHYFWEAEAYIAPVFMFSRPEVARQLLLYRHSILDKARRQAKLLGHKKGILFSWRSIDGEECSAYFPAGSAQYHINGDVCYAVKRYLQLTGDMDFINGYGAEIVFESARLWMDMGHYVDGEFCLNGVTGPDEYTAIVNNNCYTNYMARENLNFAVELWERMAGEYPEQWISLCGRIRLAETEREEFAAAAAAMKLPYDEKLGIYKQDDEFLGKKPLDFSNLKRPLLLHYHPLFIYRHQVCKQPDSLLMEFYFPERFTPEQIQRDFKYYEQIATHDSSLSSCIFSVLAAEIGQFDTAYELFLKTARADLDDLHGNTKDGLHMANMAGTWGCVVFGLGGVCVTDGGQIKFRPRQYPEIPGYRFALNGKGFVVEIAVTGTEVTYRLKQGSQAEFYHFDEPVVLDQERQDVKYQIKTGKGKGEGTL